MKRTAMHHPLVGVALLLIACCSGCQAESSHHETIEQMLSDRRQANPAWVRAQSTPAFSKDDPADFFTDPAVLEEQRKRGAEMVQSVAAAIRASKTSYTLEAGGEYRIANNKGWRLTGVENFTLHGNGARIWFERTDPADTPMRLFLTRCKNVSLKNLQVDFDPAVFIQGTITKIADDHKTIEMQIDPAWPKVSVPKGAFTIYTPEGEFVHQITRGMHHHGAKLFAGDKLRIKVWEGRRDLTPNFDKDRLAFFGDDYAVKPGYLIGLNYRTSHAVTMTHSEKITFDSVDVWQSPGIVFYEEYGVGGNVYRNCRIIRKPGTRRIHCATADHFHSRTPKNGPQIIGCEAGYTSDDIINIYGAWRWLLKQEDAKTVWLASAGGVPIGEKLAFYNRRQLTYIDESEVEEVEVLDGAELAEAQAIPIPKNAIHIVASTPGKVAKGEVFRVTLKTPIREITEAEVLIDAHSYNAENLLVKDNYFHDSFSRAQLFGGTVGAVIENNIWDKMNQGVHIFEESWAYAMGPAPQNVTFRNNTVMNLGAGSDAVITALVPKGFKMMDTQPSKNIVIRDNLFINSAGITMLWVDGGEIKNNTLVEPRGFERASGRLDTSSRMLFGHKNFFPIARNSAISVWSSHNVDVSGNTLYCSGELGDFAPLDIGQWSKNVTEFRNKIVPLGAEVKQFETDFE